MNEILLFDRSVRLALILLQRKTVKLALILLQQKTVKLAAANLTVFRCSNIAATFTDLLFDIKYRSEGIFHTNLHCHNIYP